jgi:hypothetical protein
MVMEVLQVPHAFSGTARVQVQRGCGVGGERNPKAIRQAGGAQEPGNPGSGKWQPRKRSPLKPPDQSGLGPSLNPSSGAGS